jgi:hypothetical protein
MVEMAQPTYCGLSYPLPKEDEEAIRMVNIWEKIKGGAFKFKSGFGNRGSCQE